MPHNKFFPRVLSHPAEKTEPGSHQRLVVGSLARRLPLIGKKAAPRKGKEARVSRHRVARAVARHKRHLDHVTQARAKTQTFGAVIPRILTPDTPEPHFHHALHAVI